MVRLETRELASDGYHATLDASTLDASAMVSAPVGARVRVALAARYGLLDHALRAIDAPDVSEFFAVPRYHDYQAKVQVALRERESLDAVATLLERRSEPNFRGSRPRRSSRSTKGTSSSAPRRVLLALSPSLRGRLERRGRAVVRSRRVAIRGAFRRHPGAARATHVALGAARRISLTRFCELRHHTAPASTRQARTLASTVQDRSISPRAKATSACSASHQVTTRTVTLGRQPCSTQRPTLRSIGTRVR